MKLKLTLCAVLTSSMLLSGCLNGLSTDQTLDMGLKGFQALSLSDAQVQTLSNDACANSDQNNTIAGSGTVYAKRLNNIIAGLPKNIQGKTANYKVYLTKDVNAWAMANGCIRVYSGLMDLMNDDEVRGVLGHEIGHVALGHTKSSMRLAMIAALGREALANQSNATAAALSKSQLGDFTEKFINAQFSQSQETASDDYAYNLLLEQKRDPAALASSFDKLASLGSGGGMLSSHPDPKARATRIKNRIAKDGKK